MGINFMAVPQVLPVYLQHLGKKNFTAQTLEGIQCLSLMFLQQVFEAGILILSCNSRNSMLKYKCWTFPRESSLSIFCLYFVYIFVVFASKLMASKRGCVHSSITFLHEHISSKMQGFHQPVRLPQQNHRFFPGAFGEPAKAQVLVSNENQLRPNVPLLALKGRKVPTAVGARHMQKTRKATLETLRKTMEIGKSQNQNNITTSLVGVPTIQKKHPGIRTHARIRTRGCFQYHTPTS